MAGTVTVWALVAVTVALVWLSALGILVLPDALDRLHFATPVGTLAPVAAGLAAVVHDAGLQAAVKPLVVAAVAVWSAPVVGHALGLAIDARERR